MADVESGVEIDEGALHRRFINFAKEKVPPGTARVEIESGNTVQSYRLGYTAGEPLGIDRVKFKLQEPFDDPDEASIELYAGDYMLFNLMTWRSALEEGDSGRAMVGILGGEADEFIPTSSEAAKAIVGRLLSFLDEANRDGKLEPIDTTEESRS